MTTELLILNHHLSNRVFDFSSERFGLLLFTLSRCCVSGTGCQQFSASLLRRWYKTVSKFFRNLAAERQRPQEAHQVESGNKLGQAFFGAARAASTTPPPPWAGHGRSPSGLGGSKGGHSSDKNSPLSLCCALRSNCCKTEWTSRPCLACWGIFQQASRWTPTPTSPLTRSSKRRKRWGISSPVLSDAFRYPLKVLPKSRTFSFDP